VVQIVGGTLTDRQDAVLTNFEASQPPEHFAAMYRDDRLPGGHVISLGSGNESAAKAALGAWPGGMHYGGGVNDSNARSWLDAGASHVIVTSWVFGDGNIRFDRIESLSRSIGRGRLVLDLSCRLRGNQYWVVTDRWQKFTDVALGKDVLSRLAEWCDEFLVHAADVEGLCRGIDETLVARLSEWSPVPVTYAGGARSVDDLSRVERLGGGRVDLTIGSALDIFGGGVSYRQVVELNRELEKQRATAVPAARHWRIGAPPA
jgi:phosphoribosylformimino-5-aminoimidazole carboxamide ribotide isomerase